ncbi:uncharacterized protein DEA37_0013059 [Paragonimus westermani]|uniref:Vasohibin n=1 Tax=Paragonimus westermani TaxID=34504 RepID=A0A5J4NTM4_9TREM|nr:uncharacterized protein DEA37_0013059 [Paragonimus westermani]
MIVFRLRESAKLIIEACLPIKCLEATVLAIFLTQDQKEFKRFTISFSSEFDGQTFRHVVLGVYANGKYGALGLSRRPDLMYKPLEFPTLATLIHSYAVAYVGHYHRLVKVKLGLPIPHQPHLFETLPWKASLVCSLNYLIVFRALLLRATFSGVLLRSNVCLINTRA